MSNVLTKQIRERIESQGKNTLYMVRDFADLNNDGLVTRAVLRNDYEQMKYGFIYKDAPTYDHLIDRLNTLQQTFRQLDWK